jgi:hypothetical protein
VKPSERSWPDDSDIPSPHHETTTSPNRNPADDLARNDGAPPILIRPNPDPACRFVIVEALIVLVCCFGCLWLGTTRKLVDSRQWNEKDIRLLGAGHVILRRDSVFNLLLGLGPACPLILFNQYALRKRRSWPGVTEWGWIVTGIWAVGFLTNSLFRACFRSVGTFASGHLQNVLMFLIAWGAVLLLLAGPAVVVAQLAQPWGWWRRNTWTQWLAVLSTLALSVIVYFLLDLGNPEPLS